MERVDREMVSKWLLLCGPCKFEAFMFECLCDSSGSSKTGVPAKVLYDTYLWWFSKNKELLGKRAWSLRTLVEGLRNRGVRCERVAGTMMVRGLVVYQYIYSDVYQFLLRHQKSDMS